MFAFCAAVATLAVAATAQTVAEVWPMPVQFTQGSTQLTLSPTAFNIQCTGACPDPLPAAITRYTPLIFIGTTNGKPARAVVGSAPALTGLNIVVGAEAPLQFGFDESYTLTVPEAGGAAVITANNQWGALRGLESFSQLVQWSPHGSVEYFIPSAPIAIKDAPRFQWRGALIDCSRHYLHVDTILRTIDALSYNKLNVLHWHFVDDESWPMVFANYPNFSLLGAYDPAAVYQASDVKTIVEYAYERGIMVIPEFDSPAHATVWGKAYPDLTITCPTGQTLLNPTGPVYDTLDGLLGEYDDQFQYGFVHIGGDEVENYVCWEQSAEVQAFCQQQGIANSTELRSYYEAQVQAVVAKHNARSIAWEEVFDGGFSLRNDTVVNVWLSSDELAAIVRAGYDVIYSYGWYLDQQTPPGPTHYLWVDTWQNFYANEPLNNQTLTPEQEARVLGGEASQWGEQVDDTSIDVRMWPRAAATAERLWSPRNVTDINAAEGRLEHQRCRMVQRGIRATPIRPSASYGYCQVPYQQ